MNNLAKSMINSLLEQIQKIDPRLVTEAHHEKMSTMDPIMFVLLLGGSIDESKFRHPDTREQWETNPVKLLRSEIDVEPDELVQWFLDDMPSIRQFMDEEVVESIEWTESQKDALDEVLWFADKLLDLYALIRKTAAPSDQSKIE